MSAVCEKTGTNAVSYTHLDVYKRQHQGFEYSQCPLAVISERELFGASRSPKPTRKRRNTGNVLDIFTDLSVGDYVVHEAVSYTHLDVYTRQLQYHYGRATGGGIGPV